MFLVLFLSLIMFHGQLHAQSNFIAAENKNIQSNERPAEIKNKEKWSLRIADSFINRHPASEIFDSTSCVKWTAEQGLVLEALHQLWTSTHARKYLTYIKSNIDMFIGSDGSIRTYNYNDFNLESISSGRQLLFLYSVTKEKKYKLAAETLMHQLKNQPRTKSAGFWHKKIYPGQMWLEGLYMGEPFYAQYSKMFRKTENFKDIAGQFILIKEKTLDSKTGLLFHSWDESLKEKWADSRTGRALDFSATGLGSYAMALVDVLDYFPENTPERRELVKILKDLSEALLKVRNENSGLWNEVIDQGAINGNKPNASSNYMLAYAFAKGANKGYLNKKYLNFAKEIFFRVMEKLITDSPTCRTDRQGFGPFLLTSLELEKAKMLKKKEHYFLDKNKITKF